MKSIFVILIWTLVGMSSVYSQSKNDKKMAVAVWDTYVKVESGEVVHFDILVDDKQKDIDKIFKFGQNYLKSKKYNGKLDTKHCQFCHIEEASSEMIEAISHNGYDIIEMETIPVLLQSNPTRRQMILYLRGHYEQYRFADFKDKTDQVIQEIIKSLGSGE